MQVFLALPLALVFLLSLTLCAGMIHFVLPYASRLAVAVPNMRSSHQVSTPQSGGLFLFLAILVSSFAIYFWYPNWALPMAEILLPASALCLIGWVDDRFGLSVGIRLIAFSCVALVSALSGFFSTHFLLSAFVLLVLINVTNFMDGIDGMLVVEFVPMLVMFAVLAMVGLFGVMQGFLAIGLAGALLGFFIFNRPKAKIFLGDSGSLVVGFLGGMFLLECAERNGWTVALILPAYFLADSGLTLLLRALRGEKVWCAHREHFYQQAFDSGQLNWSIILRVALCNIGLCAFAYVALGAATPILFLACIASLALVGLLLYTLVRPTRAVVVSQDAR